MTQVTKTELAQILGYSDTTLTKWLTKGMPFIHKGGKGVQSTYETKDVIKWLIDFRVAEALGGETSEDDLKAVNLKKQNQLLDERIKKEKLANDGLEGKLYPADTVEQLWTDKLVMFKTAVESLIPKLAFLLNDVKEQQKRIEIIEREFDLLLYNLSDKIVYNIDSDLFKDILREVKETLVIEKEENE